MAVRELKRTLSWLRRRDAGQESLYTVEMTDATAIRRGVLQERCQLLVLPGGRDLPYCSRLSGTGNKNIRDFVRRGGSYLGLCAGGYYGASYVKFAVGDPVLEVMGSRELKFYPGVAWGPTFPGFCYDSNAGALAVPISLQPAAKLLGKLCHFKDSSPLFMHYNGGGHFCDSERVDMHNNEDEAFPTNIQVLATYDTSFDGVISQADGPHRDSTNPISHLDDPLPKDNLAAIVSMEYGAGKVILSGVHPEASAANLAQVYGGDKYIEAHLDKLRSSESVRASVFNALISHLLN